MGYKLSIKTPSAEEQLKFLHKIQRLLDEGQFTSTYKFALLIALADLSVEKSDGYGDELVLDSREIAEKFIQLYWRQVIPFPVLRGGSGVLQQNSGKQAAIINLVNKSHGSVGGTLAKLLRERDEYQKLVTGTVKIVREMPLLKLQQIGNGIDDFLYENTMKENTITLRAGVPYCLREFHGQIISMVQGAWIRWIRRAKKNGTLLGESADLGDFLFGSERNNLAAHARILDDLQEHRCFYCGSRISGTGEVDHFIPWSRYPVDLGHNFVLAHKSCNNSKSNLLASVTHLEHWAQRNSMYGDDLSEQFNQLGIVHNMDTSVSVAKWAYQQAEITHSHLWVAKDSLEKIGGRWGEIFSDQYHAYL